MLRIQKPCDFIKFGQIEEWDQTGLPIQKSFAFKIRVRKGSNSKFVGKFVLLYCFKIDNKWLSGFWTVIFRYDISSFWAQKDGYHAGVSSEVRRGNLIDQNCSLDQILTRCREKEATIKQTTERKIERRVFFELKESEQKLPQNARFPVNLRNIRAITYDPQTETFVIKESFRHRIIYVYT